MKTYLISYDLLAPVSINNYTVLGRAIQSFGVWAKPLESLWLVKTNLTAQQIYNHLVSYTRPVDKLLVINVTNDWISKNLSNEVVKWMQLGL